MVTAPVLDPTGIPLTESRRFGRTDGDLTFYDFSLRTDIELEWLLKMALYSRKNVDFAPAPSFPAQAVHSASLQTAMRVKFS